MSTTSIRLPEALKLRVEKVARGASAHSFILSAIEEKTLQEEARAEFYAQAQARFERMLETGKAISWPEMREYLVERVKSKAAKAPTAKTIKR
jgi:predicted transcriptional regulator